MAPFDLSGLSGSFEEYALYFAIGLAFGAVLEMAGFGDSRKLAAQFYLRDMTVLKVMFTGIVVAAVLLFGASGLGLLDMERVWVNPTYLVPGIVGGLIMGVGFIVGGFCPGTSVVAASTFKIDGAVFLLGVGLGVWGFGESVHLFEDFFHSTDMGRFMLPELFGLPTGVTVVLLVSMALAMFYGGELAERVFGASARLTMSDLRPRHRWKIAGTVTLLSLALAVAIVGQPNTRDRWSALAKSAGVELKGRAPYVHPAEVVEWKKEPAVYVDILDVRSQSDFNKLHILGARRVEPDRLEDAAYVRELLGLRAQALRFVVSNGERDATAAWKVLRSLGAPNLYIIEGGMNAWLRLYPPDPCIATPKVGASNDDEQLAFTFYKAVGSSCYAAHPDLRTKEPPTDCYLSAHPEAASNASRPVPFDEHAKPAFERKVKLTTKAKAKGGCG